MGAQAAKLQPPSPPITGTQRARFSTRGSASERLPDRPPAAVGAWALAGATRIDLELHDARCPNNTHMNNSRCGTSPTVPHARPAGASANSSKRQPVRFTSAASAPSAPWLTQTPAKTSAGSTQREATSAAKRAGQTDRLAFVHTPITAPAACCCCCPRLPPSYVLAGRPPDHTPTLPPRPLTCSAMGTSLSAPRIVTRAATVCGSVSSINLQQQQQQHAPKAAPAAAVSASSSECVCPGLQTRDARAERLQAGKGHTQARWGPLQPSSPAPPPSCHSPPVHDLVHHQQQQVQVLQHRLLVNLLPAPGLVLAQGQETPRDRGQ